MRFGGIAVALALAMPSAAGAESAGFRAEVDRAKVSLLQQADDALARSIRGHGDPEQIGVSVSTLRIVSRWSMIGATMGTCYAYHTPTDMIDWLSAYDRIYFGASDLAETARAAFRKTGQEAYQESRTNGALADLSSDEKRRLCSVTLQAAREVMREL